MRDTEKMSEQAKLVWGNINWVPMEGNIEFLQHELLNSLKRNNETLEGKTLNAIFFDDGPDGYSYLASVKKIAKDWGLSLNFKEYKRGEGIEDKDAAYFIIGGTLYDQNRYAMEKGLGNPMQLSVDPYFEPSVAASVNFALRTLCRRIEKYTGIPGGRNVVVIGRSDNAFATAKFLAQDSNCTVTLVHTRTEDIAKHTKEADYIVSFAGQQNLIKAYMVKDHAAIIPVGMSRNSLGQWDNDIDYKSFENYGKRIYVADGIGPMTAALTVYRIGTVLSAYSVKYRQELKEKYGK